MNCRDMEGAILEAATGSTPDVAAAEHLRACSACAAKLAEFRATMALMDEWSAPEPSPYFDTRLRVRLREEAAQQPRTWLDWFRKPALALAMAGLFVIGATMFQGYQSPPQQQVTSELTVQPGSAVSDLEKLENNQDLYATFDVMDELDDQASENQTVNP